MNRREFCQGAIAATAAAALPAFVTAEEQWSLVRLRKHIESRLDMAHGQMSCRAYEEPYDWSVPWDHQENGIAPCVLPHGVGRIIHSTYVNEFKDMDSLPEACRLLAAEVDRVIDSQSLEGNFALWRATPRVGLAKREGANPPLYKLRFRLGIWGDNH